MNMQMHTYKGYKVTVRLAPDGMSGQVDVFDSRHPREPSLYRTTSLDKAMSWVDAYIKGEQWANEPRAEAVSK